MNALKDKFEQYEFIEKAASRTLVLHTTQLFYDEVCKRAEAKMLTTGKLEGAHYASMTAVLREWKEELEKE